MYKHKARVLGIDSESDRRILENFSYRYKILSPKQKYIINLLTNQILILLNEQPIELAQGLIHYD
jgi:hypothetical protein